MHNYLPTEYADSHSCNCIGRQPGFPKCPCMMRGLIERDGRWIEPEKDLGPVNFKNSKPRNVWEG